MTSEQNSLLKPAGVETSPELQFDGDEARLIKAQQVLNRVARLYDEHEVDDFDNDAYIQARTLLSEAGLLLSLAGYGDEDIEPITDAIKYIEHARNPDDFGISEEDEYLSRHLAYNCIYKASRINPMRDL